MSPDGKRGGDMITIHGVFGSPFVRTLRIALDEKRMKWRWSPFQLGEHKQEPYLSRHPFGKIPAVEDDGFGLYETNAVLRYIERIAPEPALIPADLHRATRMDQLLCIVDCYVFRYAAPIAFNRVIAPLIGRPVDEAAIAAAVPDTRVMLTALEKLHAGHEFFTGDTLTLADIALLPHIDLLNKTPEGKTLLAETPKILGWLDAMRARASVKASARPPEEVLAAA
jgi:glutathione S-transferase